MAASKNTKLTSEQQIFIVESLACYRQLSEVKAEFKARFGREVSSQQVESYNPHQHQGRNLSERWRILFKSTRDAFEREAVTRVPIASSVFRLMKLQEHYDSVLTKAQTATDRNNLVLAKSFIETANDILERAAKETGGAYTNKRQLSGPDGGPIAMTHRTLNDFYADPNAAAHA